MDLESSLFAEGLKFKKKKKKISFFPVFAKGLLNVAHKNQHLAELEMVWNALSLDKINTWL